ncbi:MAG TPA: hypothetical protein PLN49_05075, partial [Ferruginibacter sp.]|nr:hypothetical protein [Ferruginibacter sp.]
ADSGQQRADGISQPQPAQPLPEAAVVAVPSADERYQVRKLLGRGGMGEVQLSRDQVIGREVAVKRMLPERQSDDVARTRFLREAQIQGQLEHPGIVPVYDLSMASDGSAFFTMKRLRGRTLEDIVLEKVTEYSYPVCFDFPVGHQKNNVALKCGVLHTLGVHLNECRLTEA